MNLEDSITYMPVSARMTDLTNKSFDRLTALGYVGKDKYGQSRWHCQCVCGMKIIALAGNLKRLHTSSCGCRELEVLIARSIKHGQARRSKLSIEYKIWCGIRGRCNNVNNPAYIDYGARGIKVWPDWDADFECFWRYVIDTLGERPSKEHSIDRIDNDEGYKPGNIRWATAKDQARNRRSNHVLEYKGQCKSIAEWSAEHNICQIRVRRRIVELGWTVEKALTTPVRGTVI